jgi:hypothetical protein
MTTEITLIEKSGCGAVMSKRIFLDENGNLKSDGSQCLMVGGTATRVTVETAKDLATIIRNCGSHQAIALGALKEDLPSPAPLTTKARLSSKPGSITRSRKYIDYRPETPAWVLVDVDIKGLPSHVREQLDAAGGVWNAILTIAPGLERAARVSRASTSSGLYRLDTGEILSGSGGFHHYLLVKDGSDIERFLRDLHERCWLSGFGWYVLSATGQLLERSLVDCMVGYGERLCFEGAPLIEPPLAQDLSKREPQAVEGEAINTKQAVPPLSSCEMQLLKDIKANNERLLETQATKARTNYNRKRVQKLTVKLGLPEASALRMVEKMHRGILSPQDELEFDHLGSHTVADVLADPEQFVDETLADPREGTDYGRCKAKVMRADDGKLFIHSFAHGRSIYNLRYDATEAKAAIVKGPAPGAVDHGMSILAQSDLEPDELEEFISALSKVSGVGVRAIKARVNKEQKKWAHRARAAALASKLDGRIVMPRPEPDGELTPTTERLDQILAADPSAEPPMRNASGHLVEVRASEPWNLHSLTADGSNGAVGDTESLKAPPEPMIIPLTQTGVEILVEQYFQLTVVKERKTYFGALPKPFVDALMQLSTSIIPKVRAINATPLVSLSGKVIGGVGLDRNTGLFHRIDPLLRACVPEAPTEQDVKNALRYVMDDWLVDVALDPVGKCIAIMLALTLIERVLLPERPAFFVTAGQRGGGKTTLVNMITLAVLGRSAAAASWSNDPEERKKALFSYLRQGVACITWDNIARGAAITCPHIEAALTASEISDRVLQFSRAETVPSTAIHIFTGNTILPRGDMASRSLMLSLNVDRPDPENRSFEHADPMSWTQANRPKILSALYTLLIAGAQNRPPQQEAKTRFKTWWKLVGWPMEYAAALLAITLDCTELMRVGEADDEDASSVSVALTVLWQVWGDRPFTSRDVASAMKADFSAGNTLNDAMKAAAGSIADAITQLAGKPMDHPTPHNIGKLFQKCLVGRPAWLADGKTTATLQKSSGHGNNTYRIKLSGDRGRQDDSPHSPHSPNDPSDDNRKGNVGKEGIDPDGFPENFLDLV